MIVVKRILVTCVLASLLLIPLQMIRAQENAITVTSTTDAIADDGQCTLREAIIAANTNTPSGDTSGSPCAAGSDADTDTIMLPVDATISLTLPGAGENASATGDLDIANNSAATDVVLMTPISLGAASTISQDASPDDRVIEILSGASVQINFVTITGGTAPNVVGDTSGGGIMNWGTLTLYGSTVSGNSAASGGGIASFYTDRINGLTVNESLIAGNTASAYGGGINMHSGTITNSEVLGNSASNGGGIAMGFMATFDHTTIMQNTATERGGGIYNGGSLTIQNGSLITGNWAQNGGGIGGGGVTYFDASALTGNSAGSSGGGLNLQNGSAHFRNGSEVSNNTATQAGGGIYHANSTVTVTASRVQGNTALIGGGIFHLSTGTTRVTDSVLISNRNTSNSVSGSAVHVYDGVAANAFSITGSCITGNSYIAVNSSSVNVQTASGNWWGSPSGPNPPGSGDSVSGAWNTSGSLTSPPAACNLITNGTMQADANGDNLPDGFTYSQLTAQDGRVCTVATDCVLKLVGNGSTKTAAQVISQAGGAGDRYTLRIDHDAKNIPGSGVMRVDVQFSLGGASTEQYALNLNSGTHGWQMLSLPITTAGSYDQIQVVITYRKNNGTLQVDDLSLVREP